MSVAVIDPPVGGVVSLEEAKAHLAVDHDDHDDLIEGLVRAATQYVDGPTGFLGRALLKQTLELRTSSLCGEVALQCPPIIEVLSVKYDDGDGAEQTLDADTYRLLGASGRPRLALGYGKSWPSTRYEAESVRVQYDAGYGETADDVPEPTKHAIKLLLSHWYHNREAAAEANLSSIPMGVDALLAPYRVFTL